MAAFPDTVFFNKDSIVEGKSDFRTCVVETNPCEMLETFREFLPVYADFHEFVPEMIRKFLRTYHNPISGLEDLKACIIPPNLFDPLFRPMENWDTEAVGPRVIVLRAYFLRFYRVARNKNMKHFLLLFLGENFNGGMLPRSKRINNRMALPRVNPDRIRNFS